MWWAYFSAGRSGLLIQIHGIVDSIKYQQIKKSKAKVNSLIPSSAVAFFDNLFYFYYHQSSK